MRTNRLFLVLAAGAFLAGCSYATQEETKALAADLAQLKTRQEKFDSQAADLQKATKEADAQMKKLHEVVEEATKVVTRNSANLGQDVDRLKNDMAGVGGQISDVTKRLDDVNATLAALTKSFNEFRASSDTKLEKLQNESASAKTPPVPETPDGVFAEAMRRYEAKQWNDARRLFDAFISRYPNDNRAAKAQYLIGEAYFAEGKYANAIGAFSKVIDNFPKSEMVPDAMFRNGTAFYALKYCGDARIYFQELLRRYPKTEWKKDANEQLKKIQKDAKDRSVCNQT